MEAKSQLEAVRKHLVGFGHITSVDAINTYGITRLSHYIWLLREEGYTITTLRKQVISQYGNKGSQAIYKLLNYK
jgi:hypothetical protein